MAVVHQHETGALHRDRRDAVVWLHEDGADVPGVAGSKAANIAVARRAGFPTVEGFVITVSEVRAHPRLPSPVVAQEWRELSAGGSVSLVVRSSSPAEDLANTSMAGQFDSVVDVRGWDHFVTAYRQVAASGGDAEMAVLVQRLLTPELGGVLFGVDPVSGRHDRVVIASVEGGPHHLVSGEVEGRRVVVRRSGTVVAADGDAAPVLSRRDRRRLLALAERLERVFGGPQDVEWAIDDDRLYLLQARPVTAVAEEGTGPLLGPGPVAETFPEPLTRLETDLWIPPLRAATAETLRITGSAGNRRIARSPVVTAVDSQVVVDLELTGVAHTGSRVLRVVDPRPPVRRLVAAWRVGRLRGAFPQLAANVVLEVDRHLEAVPDPTTLTDDELLRILENAQSHLRVLHTHEMLAGALMPFEGATAAGVALREIARGRTRGWSDEDIVARSPVVLAVVPPSTGPRAPLPPVAQVPADTTTTIAMREQLRLRVRWVHELTRQVVRELAARLHVRGIAERDDVRHLSLTDVQAALEGAPHGAPVPLGAVTPVPAQFRLSQSGAVVTSAAAADGHGTGAGGGRGVGPVSHAEPAPGDVLVVRTLDPALAAVLPTVGGIVAETGSPLSHLAILAREQSVPVVVGFAGALERFPTGSMVVVDGGTGVVDIVVRSEEAP